MKFQFRYSSTIVFVLSILLASCCHENKVIIEKHSHFVDTTKVMKTICFGSCNKQWEDQSYWQNIRNENPDLWIWMGDIIYSDTEDMAQLKGQYNIQKVQEEYLNFIDSIQVLGIWDDHDYGVNDGGREYPARKESRDLLFDFLDIDETNSAWSREGAYQSYTFGTDRQKVKIILLDGRYFKDNLSLDNNSEQRYLPTTEGTYLGEKQWRWFENELNNSDAQLNLIVSGVQVISSEHFFEKWANFPQERQRLFDLLRSSGVKNPVVLSGDRHIGEISKLEIDSTFILYDATSSGLTHSYEQADEENEFRVGDLIPVKNFGTISLEWSEEEVSISIELKSIEGVTLSNIDL